MKKVLSVILVLIIFVSSPIFSNSKYAVAETEQSEIELELDKNVNEQLGSLDFSEIDKIYTDIINNNLGLTSETFGEKVKKIISGDLSVNSASLMSYVGNVFIDDILAFLPSICLIIAIAILYSMLSSLKTKNGGVGEIIHFVSYGTILIIVLSGLGSIINLTSSTIGGIKNQMNGVFPLLLTVLTALGGTTSVSVYQPAMAVLSSSLINVFTGVLLPLFTFKIVFDVISNLSKSIRFNKFSEFFGSCFKWILGIVLTVFSAFVSIQGIMAGSVDGVSIRTAKYTIKGGVPVIGSFIADGMGLIMISSSLIKNAIGMGGLILMFCTIILPVIKILVFSLLMKLASAILEPISDSRISGFVSGISKSIATLIALLLGVAFMYFILVALVMCSANIF